MKKKGFIMTLVCTMLLTAAAGMMVSVLMTRNGPGKPPGLAGDPNKESAVSEVSAQVKDSGFSSAESTVTESGKETADTESRKGTKTSGRSSAEGTESPDTSVSASAAEGASAAEDASGTESSEGSGLSTAIKRYDPELLLPDGRRAYEYTTPPEGSVIDYADFSAEELVGAVAAVYRMAHDRNFQYGNSVSIPPCEDGFISCERLIARALWDLGITDQPRGGVQMYMEGTDEEGWFTRHGFVKVNDPSLLQRGDILYLQVYDENGQPKEVWDNFVLTAFDPETQMCEKYDCGHFTPEGVDRISAEQPFYAPLAEYGEARRFVCAFRLRERPVEETAAVG